MRGEERRGGEVLCEVSVCVPCSDWFFWSNKTAFQNRPQLLEPWLRLSLLLLLLWYFFVVAETAVLCVNMCVHSSTMAGKAPVLLAVSA